MKLNFFFFALFISGSLLAHKPFFSENLYTDSSSAFAVEDPDISIVVYHEVKKCNPNQLWLKLKIAKAEELFIQLGVPEIDRLTDYRPNIALIAKGLDESYTKDLPLGLNMPGYRAKIFTSEDYIDKDFYEPFTTTSSWIKIEEKIQVNELGDAFVVAWHPQKLEGKLFVAVGETEKFGKDDIKNFRETKLRVQEFHELGIFEDENSLNLECSDSKTEASEASGEKPNNQDLATAEVNEESDLVAETGGCSLDPSSRLTDFFQILAFLSLSLIFWIRRTHSVR